VRPQAPYPVHSQHRDCNMSVRTNIKGRCVTTLYDTRTGRFTEKQCRGYVDGPDHETNLKTAESEGWSVAFDGAGVMWAHCPTCVDRCKLLGDEVGG